MAAYSELNRWEVEASQEECHELETPVLDSEF